jgi:hypothetical protein
MGDTGSETEPEERHGHGKPHVNQCEKGVIVAMRYTATVSCIKTFTKEGRKNTGFPEWLSEQTSYSKSSFEL